MDLPVEPREHIAIANDQETLYTRSDGQMTQSDLIQPCESKQHRLAFSDKALRGLQVSHVCNSLPLSVCVCSVACVLFVACFQGKHDRVHLSSSRSVCDSVGKPEFASPSSLFTSATVGPVRSVTGDL